MAKYQQIAQKVREYLKEHRLKPGDMLPSERLLAKEFGVAYGTVRLAYDSLYRAGLIDRHQGRGTFVAQPPPQAPAPHCGRLGLLPVDMQGYESPYLRHLTYDIQRLARKAEYELVVDYLEMEDVVAGRMPPMIERRSVDGFFVYGRVRDFHIPYFENQPLPYILVGNYRVTQAAPQVTLDAEGIGYQMAKLLRQMGRSPVWLDVDPTNTRYETGQQMLRGYARAMQETGNGELHLCSLRMDRIDQAAEQLSRTDLHQAAFIVQDWSASLLMTPLLARCPHAGKLLLAPYPSTDLCKLMRGPNVMQWDHSISIADLAGPAADQLLACLNGKCERPMSVHLDAKCAVKSGGDIPCMSLRVRKKTIKPADAGREDRAIEPVGTWAT